MQSFLIINMLYLCGVLAGKASLDILHCHLNVSLYINHVSHKYNNIIYMEWAHVVSRPNMVIIKDKLQAKCMLYFMQA